MRYKLNQVVNLLHVMAMLLLPFLPAVALAQTPISPNSWTGQGASAAGPSIFTALPASATPGAAVVNVSQWNRAGSIAPNSAGGTYNSTSWLVGGSLAAAQAANSYVYFTITNNAATELHITQLFIMSQVSATGPQSVQIAYSIGSGPDVLFGPGISTAHSASAENWTVNSSVCLAPSQTATFKLYAWGGTGAAGTLRINNGTALTAVFAPGITASSATNSSPVCQGNPINFTGTFTGGIPGYTFSWAGPAGYTSALQNPTIASPGVSAAGTYTFTVTDALTCTAAVAATTTATVTAAPPASTGTTEVCEGLTTTLSNAASGGTWSSGNTAVATVGATSGIVSGIAAGTALITYSIGTTCLATTIVTVQPSPLPVTGGGPVCVGFTISLGNATAGGAWSSGATGIATVSAIGVVTGIAAGTAVISYTLPLGCFSTAIVTVNAFPDAITGPSAVCIGSTINLSNASPSGTWTSSNTVVATIDAATGVLSGISQGTATITYTLAGGCFVTTNVTVNPLPANISGTAVVCAGAVTLLSNGTPAGVWSSGNVAIATVNTFGLVTGVAQGTATISYTLGTGCYKTIIVTVNATPGPITGPAGVCIGSSVTLTNALPGGTWTSNNIAVATIGLTTGVVSSVAVGTTVITYKLTATGCFTSRVETVNPLPLAITGPNEVCPGTSVSMADASPGGTWSVNPTTVATAGITSGIITGVAAGTAIITYTLPTTCTATKVITVNPAPLSIITPIGDTAMCPGDFVTLTANTDSGLTYHWLVAGTFIPGADISTHITYTGGSYQAQTTNGFGCSTLSVPMLVSINPATAAVSVPGGAVSGCIASGVMLSANTGTGLIYQWVLDGTSVPGATNSDFTAFTGGDYQVIVTNSTGCFATSAAQNVNIFPSPTAVATVSGPLTFCAGNTVSISTTPGAGLVYQWYSAAGSISGATTNTYVAATSGTYYVMVTNSFGCSATSVSTNVVVNPLPDVTISGGPKVFCAEGSVLLTASSLPGYSYQWYNGGVAIVGATNSAYTASSTGGYRVRVTNTVTGCTDITHADTVATLIASPVIVPLTPPAFCWGGSSVLSTSVSSVGFAVSYQWFAGTLPISGATSATYTANQSGSYSCQITIPASCVTTTAVLSVIEYPLPDPVITYTAGTLRTVHPYVTYQWYKELLPLAGATSATLTPTASGSYKVFVTDSNGCQSASAAYVFSNGHGATAVSNYQAEADIHVYPNPARNILHIESNQPLNAVITGIDGRQVAGLQNVKDIDVSAFTAGIYLLRLYDEHNNLLKTDKFVKVAE